MKTNRFPLLFGLLAISLSPVHAQEAAQAAPEEKTEPTVEEVTRYVGQITDRIGKRKERATAMVNEIVALDKSIQGNVDQILKTLGGMTDSNDSRTRVARTKRDMIERLGKAAQYYARLRADLEEQLRHSDNPFRKEDLFKEREAFDERIDKMIQGAVGLALSMDTHEDHDKYIVESGGSDWGWDTNYRDNPEFEQNRRAARQTDSTVRALGEAFDKATGRLDLKIKEMQQSLRATDLDAEKRKAMETELTRLQVLREQRAAQEAALYTHHDSPATSDVGLNEAVRSEKWVESIAQEARRDFNQMIARYRELRVERDTIADLRKRLDHAEGWLKAKQEKP
ncbi:MAG: hypothetical protein ACKO2G_14780 [Verrucomicrobiales bacterium]